MELGSKNKIIYDLKARENWLSAELSGFRFKEKQKNPDNPFQPGNGDSQPLDELLTKKNLTKSELELARVKVLQTLLHFKKELSKAKTIIDQNSKMLVESERKRISLEEETIYLKSAIDASSHKSDLNLSTIEQSRIRDFSIKLDESQIEIMTLQSKLAQWAKYAKQHQDGMLIKGNLILY